MQNSVPLSGSPETPALPAFLQKRVPKALCFFLMLFLAVSFAVVDLTLTETPLWVSSVLEVGLLLLPCAAVLLFSRSRLPLAPISATRLLFVTGMGVTGYGFTLTLNSSWALLWTFILGTDTTEAAQHTAEQMQSAPLWFLILVIAVTPAICEELFFRGLLLKSYAAAPAAALCMSSALFSLLHYDVLRLFPTFYLGMFFGWVVMRTGNLTAGMILHFLNNTFSVVAMKFSYTFLERFGGEIDYDLLQQILEGNPKLTMQLLSAELILLALILLAVPLFILLLIHFIRDTREDAQRIHLAALNVIEKPKKLYSILFIILAAVMLCMAFVIQNTM